MFDSLIVAIFLRADKLINSAKNKRTAIPGTLAAIKISVQMKLLLIIFACSFNFFSLHSQVLTNHLSQKWIKIASYDPYNKIMSHNPAKQDFISKIDTSNYKTTFQFIS